VLAIGSAYGSLIDWQQNMEDLEDQAATHGMDWDTNDIDSIKRQA